MARERKRFDSPGFIEAVRQQSVPSYHTVGDQTSATPQAQPPPEVTVNQELPASLCDLNLTEKELDFIKSYVANNSGGQISRKGKPIVIRESHRRMICDIFYLFGENPNMAQYIDNVLAEHFRQYYPIIQGISRKCPPKF